MRRFVTYIYEYERGNRGRNVGFIRTDIRDDCCRMEVHIRGLDRFKGKGQVYLVADSAAPMGISAGELLLNQGMGHLKLTCPSNRLGKSGYTVSQLLAFVVRYGNGKMLVGSFVNEPDEKILRGEFEIRNPGGNADGESVSPSVLQNDTVSAASPALQDDTVSAASPALHDDTVSAASSALQDDTALEHDSQDAQITYQQIEITDIRKLPRRNWYLCNNSFLVHGFFNYHYLILKTVERDGQTQKFLGVPGIYEQPERMMALLFGFPEFEAAQPTNSAGVQTSDSENANGVFGYWMCSLTES